MPTYQFRCPDGTIVERMFKISEVPDTIPVPNGEGDAVRIISGGAGLIFKGSGFYITDYGKDGKKDQREAGKSDATSAKAEAPKVDASPAKSESPKSAPASGSGSSE